MLAKFYLCSKVSRRTLFLQSSVYTDLYRMLKKSYTNLLKEEKRFLVNLNELKKIFKIVSFAID